MSSPVMKFRNFAEAPFSDRGEESGTGSTEDRRKPANDFGLLTLTPNKGEKFIDSPTKFLNLHTELPQNGISPFPALATVPHDVDGHFDVSCLVPASPLTSLHPASQAASAADSLFNMSSPLPLARPKKTVLSNLMSPGLFNMCESFSPLIKVGLESPAICDIASPSVKEDDPRCRLNLHREVHEEKVLAPGSQIGSMATLPFPSPSSYPQSSGSLDLGSPSVPDPNKEVQRRIDFTVVKKSDRPTYQAKQRANPTSRWPADTIKAKTMPRPAPAAKSAKSAPAKAATNGKAISANGNAGGGSKSRQCNCKKSRCLKLYCECFAAGILCSGCNCVNCQNLNEHISVRNKAIEETLSRNPNAFQAKIDEAKGAGSSKHTKGCACKKSNCKKKYCECFQAGILCSDMCKCKNCRNNGLDHSEDDAPAAKRQNTGNTEVEREPVKQEVLVKQETRAAPIMATASNTVLTPSVEVTTEMGCGPAAMTVQPQPIPMMM